MNRWAVDFFMTHVCAIALIIDNFELNTEDIVEDFKLELKEYRCLFSTIYLQ